MNGLQPALRARLPLRLLSHPRPPLPRRRRCYADGPLHHHPLRPHPPPSLPPQPLDPSITGLTPLPLNSREASIRRLLVAISARRDTAIWHHFTAIAVANLTPRLTAADFSSILLSLRPARYVSLKARHYLNDYGAPRLMPLRISYDEFRRRLHAVSVQMEANGYQMGVHEYTHLLDCARAGGDGRLAEQLWRRMARSGVQPDTWAYNSYMAALCGTAASERERRVTERVLKMRSRSNVNVRTRALTIYRAMIERGVTPNSMTFDLLMLAMSRMGDMAGVTKTLKDVWDVDIGGDTDAAELPPVVPKDSPLAPTEHTIVAVAAAFGTNGDVEGAVRTVDHLARRYKLTIRTPSWVMLLNWTYVATRPPLKVLPKYSPVNLWDIMTSPPYSIQPTIEMYDYLVRSLIARKMHPEASEVINQALKEYERQLIDAESAHESAQDTEIEIAWRRRSEFRSRSMIRRWAELLCLGKGMRVNHARVVVPNVVRRLGWFLGDRVTYVTATGYVDLHRGKETSWRPMSVRRRKRVWTPLGTGSKEMDYLD